MHFRFRSLHVCKANFVLIRSFKNDFFLFQPYLKLNILQCTQIELCAVKRRIASSIFNKINKIVNLIEEIAFANFSVFWLEWLK